jgi:hypothetical protein
LDFSLFSNRVVFIIFANSVVHLSHPRCNLKYLAAHVAIRREQDSPAQIAHKDEATGLLTIVIDGDPRPFAWVSLKKLTITLFLCAEQGLQIWAKRGTTVPAPLEP